MQQALKGLKEDKSSLILPADKGRASVVLDNHDEMKILIDSLSHTDNLTQKRSGYLTEPVYNKIRPLT